ncbi:hypothetical protein ACFC0M_25520 [Streptomyces sp. NPDC056149]|uniref:hypothetical protein n=1 Tax=Streptomyces sp. NPDC056149 TaxID=3345728 RepID=UPI0035E1A89F
MERKFDDPYLSIGASGPHPIRSVRHRCGVGPRGQVRAVTSTAETAMIAPKISGVAAVTTRPVPWWCRPATAQTGVP